MTASPSRLVSLRLRLLAATDAAHVDALLDEWLDYRDQATEWDAQLWQLGDVERRTRRDRHELTRRALMAGGPPPMDHEGTTL